MGILKCRLAVGVLTVGLCAGALAQVSQEGLNASLAGEVWLDDWENAFETLAQGADPNTKLQDGTPVLAECIRSNPAFAKALIERGADPNTMGEWGWPVLCSAAAVDLELTRILVERGADLKARTKDGYSALTAAALADRPAVVAYLLGKGFAVEERSTVGGDGSDRMAGVTPLMVAAKHAAVGSMKVLLDAGADPKALSEGGVTPLAFALSGYAAINYSDADRDQKSEKVNAAMALLLDRGAPVDQRTACRFFYPGSSWDPLSSFVSEVDGRCGFTPLMLAAAHLWYPAAQFLVRRGADPNARSGGGIPALFWAAQRDGDAMLGWFLEAGADPNATGNFSGLIQEKGVTALMVAAAAGARGSVKMLLAKRADPNRTSAEGIPTLAFPWRNHHEQVEPEVQLAVAQALLDGGADVDGRPLNTEPGAAWVPAALAVYREGGCQGALWLLDHGADPRLAGTDGQSLCAWVTPRTPIPQEYLVHLPECNRRAMGLCN